MPAPSVEFSEALLAGFGPEFVTERIFSGPPFIFRENADNYTTFKGALGHALGVGADDVVIVGSARLGFSVRPDKFGEAFGENSDVDVIVVSQTLFDQSWIDLLRWHHSRKWALPRWKVREILDHSRKSVYWGHLWPDLLVRISDVAKRWIPGFRGLSKVAALAPYHYNGRLYRTWEHALMYLLQSIRRTCSLHT